MDIEKEYYEFVNFIKKNRNRVISMEEIERKFLERNGNARVLFQKFIENGIIRNFKKKLFVNPYIDIELGRLALHRNGFGFLCPLSGDDVFIPPRFIKNAMNGDIVIAGVSPRKRRREGWIIDIVHHSTERMVARFVDDAHQPRALPLDEKANFEILIEKKEKEKNKLLRDGQIVLVRLKKLPTKDRDAYGVIEKVIEEDNAYETDLKTILFKYDIRPEFSRETYEELKRIPDELSEDDYRNRKDLRKLPFITIDGEDAKDFDDAVYVEELDKDSMILLVSIADVSHYVIEGSALNRDALSRGTSVYFPDRAIPMLPEKLSNNLASLKPGVDRLTVTVEMEINKKGRIRRSAIYPSVIRSAKRITYTLVRELLEGKEFGREYERLKNMLQKMYVLRNRLLEMRMARGSLIFDLPEPKVILNENKDPVDVKKFLVDFSHSIIEEFMLAANETVAETLERARIPFIYRIHEPPDIVDMKNLAQFLSKRGYKLVLKDGDVEPMDLQKVLNQCRNKQDEFLINTLVLRSLKQARYSPVNKGHFGLASRSYCHFTSPIRRYPDLIVHRILKKYLSRSLTKETIDHLKSTLEYASYNSSERERVAMEAEREMVDRLRARFMMNKLGQEFDAKITMVKEGGIFVELNDFFVEGFIPVDDMDDYYIFDPASFSLRGKRRRKQLKIGDEVKVIATNVNLDFGRVNFKLKGY